MSSRRPPHVATLVVTGLWALAGAPEAVARTSLPVDGETAQAQDAAPVQDSAARQDSAAALQDSIAALRDSLTALQQVEPVTDERAVQDETIRNQLQAVFDRVPDLATVDVTVDAGVVLLEGTVLRGETGERAGELAAQMEGVLFVDNRIRETTSLEQQLRPTWAGLRTLGYSAVAKLPLLAVALVIVGLAVWASARLSRWGGPAFLRLRNPFLQSLVQRLLRVAVVVAGLLVAVDLLDITALVGAAVGTAGLAGIALGFAFKDIVENYLAGLLLALRQPFEKNDHIRVDSFEGKVVRLTARETILMTLDGNHVRLPNALIFRSPMLNFTRNPLRRFQFEAGLGTRDDLARARKVAVATLAEMDGVLSDPAPEVQVLRLGDSAITLCFSGWVDQRHFDYLRVRSEAIRSVKTRLEAAGLTLPAPEYVVRLGDDGGAPLAPSPAVAGPERTRPAPTVPVPAVAPAAPSDEPPPDVSPDRSLERQMEEERRASTEPDLLDRSDGSDTAARSPDAPPR